MSQVLQMMEVLVVAEVNCGAGGAGNTPPVSSPIAPVQGYGGNRSSKFCAFKSICILVVEAVEQEALEVAPGSTRGGPGGIGLSKFNSTSFSSRNSVIGGGGGGASEGGPQWNS